SSAHPANLSQGITSACGVTAPPPIAALKTDSDPFKFGPFFALPGEGSMHPAPTTAQGPRRRRRRKRRRCLGPALGQRLKRNQAMMYQTGNNLTQREIDDADGDADF